MVKAAHDESPIDAEVRQRLTDLAEQLRTSESAICLGAGLSRSALSTSRARAGGLRWSTLAPIVLYLAREHHVRPHYVLFGELPVHETVPPLPEIETLASLPVASKPVRPRK